MAGGNEEKKNHEIGKVEIETVDNPDRFSAANCVGEKNNSYRNDTSEETTTRSNSNSSLKAKTLKT